MSVLQVKNRNRSTDVADVCKQAMQEGIRNSINVKLAQLEKTSDPITLMILENEIKLLNSRLDADDTEINSINAAIEAAKEAKRAMMAPAGGRGIAPSRATRSYQDVIHFGSDGKMTRGQARVQTGYGGLSNYGSFAWN